MGSHKSFLARVSPNRPRSRVMDWPLPTDAEAPPRVRVLVLSLPVLEQAHFAAIDYFRSIKRKVEVGSPVFEVRERIELVWRAFRDIETEGPIATSAEDIAEAFTAGQRDALYLAWREIQEEMTERALDRTEILELVEQIKKNTLPARLEELPSTSLKELIRTLADQWPSSTAPNSSGS